MSPRLTIQDRKQRIIAACDRLMPEAWGIAQRIGELKELSGAEHESARLLSDRLRAAGATVELGVGRLPTAFRAKFSRTDQGPARDVRGPRIALLAEYDALPDLGHACGHHLSGVASAFAAIALAESGVVASPSHSPSHREGEKQGGTIEVIGTPMEEKGGGKIHMVDAGVFHGVDVALMTHTSNETRAAYRTMASQAFRIVLTADPKEWHWRSRNITDVLLDVLTVLRIVENRSGVGTQILWAIPEGGSQNNVVPSRMVVDIGIWSYDAATLKRTIARIRERCMRVGERTKVGIAFDMYEPMYFPFEPNEVIVATFERNLKTLDVPFEPRQGRLNDSIDTGNVSQVIPTLHADIVVDDSRTHTPEHAIACSGPAGERYLRTAMAALALTAFDLLHDPEDIARAQRELAARIQPKELKPGRLP